MAKWDDHVARRLCCTLVVVALIASTRTAVCFLTSTSRPSLDVRWRHREPARSTLTTATGGFGHLHCRRYSPLPYSLSSSSSGEALPRFPLRARHSGISSGISGDGESRACSSSTSCGSRRSSRCSITATTLTDGDGAAAAGSETRDGGVRAAAGAAVEAGVAVAACEGHANGLSSSTRPVSDEARSSSDENPAVGPAACEGGEERVGSR